jgi:hypothetical protein
MQIAQYGDTELPGILPFPPRVLCSSVWAGSLVRRLVETMGETSTKRIGLAHYLCQLGSTTSGLRDRAKGVLNNQYILNPPKSGLNGIYHQHIRSTLNKDVLVHTLANHN